MVAAKHSLAVLGLLLFVAFVAAKGFRARDAPLEFKQKEHSVVMRDILSEIKLKDPFAPTKGALLRKRQVTLPVNDSYLQSAVICSQYSALKRNTFVPRDVTTGDAATTGVPVAVGTTDVPPTPATTDAVGTTAFVGTTDVPATTDAVGTTAFVGTTGTTGTTGSDVVAPPVLTFCTPETALRAGDDPEAHDLVFNPKTNEFIGVSINKFTSGANTYYDIIGHRYDADGNPVGNDFFLTPSLEESPPKANLQVEVNVETNTYLVVFELDLDFGSEVWSVGFEGVNFTQTSAQAYASPGKYDRFPQITANPATSSYLLSWELRNSQDVDTDVFIVHVTSDGAPLGATSWGSLFDDRAPDVAFNPATGGYLLVMEVGFGIYAFLVNSAGIPTVVNYQFVSNPEQIYLDHDPVLVYNIQSLSFYMLWETYIADTTFNVIYHRKLSNFALPVDLAYRLTEPTVAPVTAVPDPVYDPVSNNWIVFFHTANEFLNASFPNTNNIKAAVVNNENTLDLRQIIQINSKNFNEHHPHAAMNTIKNKILLFWGHGLDIDPFVPGTVVESITGFSPTPFTTGAGIISPLTPEQTFSIVIPVLIGVAAGVAIAVFCGLMWWQRKKAQKATLNKAAMELDETAKQRDVADRMS